MSGLDEAVKDFLIESHENLDQLDRDFLVLEQDPLHRDSLASVFRTMHTIKGTCSFFGFHVLGALSHSAENLLSQIREGKRRYTSEIASTLLSLVDAIRKLLGSIERTGKEGSDNFVALNSRLAALVKGDAPEPPSPANTDALADSGIDALSSPLADGTIRVDLGLLDRLMNLVGELVLVRNQVLQCTDTLKEARFLANAQRLNQITNELQEQFMKTRMQPIAAIWNKLPRTSRDIAVACGKKIQLTMEGKETELDKSIIEAIKDPLTHLLRNAIDHGIEAPDERVRLGKPADGMIHLKAYHEGGQVNIEITDDGRGIAHERVRAKAIERGLIGRTQAEAMSDRDVLQFIFVPGFSTATVVTSVSGRGVGMDVVKTNIEKINGTVDLLSKVGQGTTIHIKIPLTLAIIPALLVSCDGAAYAIPQVNLLELVRIEANQVATAIEDIRGARVHRLRGKLLPLVFLRELFGGSPMPTGGAVNVVVLQADNRLFGLVVDAINDTEEIVVKPLGKHLKNISIYAGATILGDGRVALILDVIGVAQQSGVVVENRERVVTDRTIKVEDRSKTCQTVLLVGAGRDRRLAVPLNQVTRLEEFKASDVDFTVGGAVAQYRDGIITLHRLSDLLGLPSSVDHADRAWQVVVHGDGSRVCGIAVDRIYDIVETTLEIVPLHTERPGILGTTVVQGRIIEVIDPMRLLASRPARVLVEA